MCYLNNIATTRVPARNFLIIAPSEKEMLPMLIWVELETVWDFTIRQLCDALSRLSIPQFNESIVRSGQEFLTVVSEIKSSYPLKI